MNRTASAVRPRPVSIEGAGVSLAGDLSLPSGTRGLVLFAHGSGSSRFSTRNRFVAEVLTEAGIGTLLFDLLTSSEEGDRERVFDIPLLAGRLALATEWVASGPGQKFNVPGDSSFEIRVREAYHYICHFG